MYTVARSVRFIRVFAIVASLVAGVAATPAHAGARREARKAFRELKQASSETAQAYQAAKKERKVATHLWTGVSMLTMGAGWHFLGTVGFPVGHGFGVAKDLLGIGALRQAVARRRWAREDLIDRALKGQLGAKAQSIALKNLEIIRSSKLVTAAYEPASP